MECVNLNDNGYLVTIALQMHGKVIDLNLTPETQNIFNDVRLYSQSGDFRDVLSTPLNDTSILSKLNEIFQKKLDKPSLNSIDEYIEHMGPKYKSFLESRAPEEYSKEDREKVCRQFSNIIFDKSLSTSTSSDDSIISCILEKLMPEFHGIFLVSIHKKKTNNIEYKLIYPTNSQENLDLLNINNFKKFANIFNKNLPDLKKISFELPVSEYIKREKVIEEDNNLTKEEKKQLMEQQKREFYEILSNWDITIKDNKIESIRMSTLTKLIKDIIGKNSFINLFDYSCSSITKYLPEEQRYHKKYLETSNIENPPYRSWGGRGRGKIKKKKAQLATKNKRHKKNKKSIKNKTKKLNH